MNYIKFAATVGLLILNSCVSTAEKEYCNSQSARSYGYSDISNGRHDLPNLRAGKICEDDYLYTNYKKDYYRGVSRAYRNTCSHRAMRKKASFDAKNLRMNRPGLKNASVCRHNSKFKNYSVVYNQQFSKEFCTVHNLSKLTRMKAKKMKRMNPKKVLRFCRGNQKVMNMDLMKIYEIEIVNQCSLLAMSRRGSNAAANNMKMSVGNKYASKCPAHLQEMSIKSFRSAYIDQERLMNERKKLELQEQQAAAQIEKIRYERELIKSRNEIIKNREAESFNTTSFNPTTNSRLLFGSSGKNIYAYLEDGNSGDLNYKDARTGNSKIHDSRIDNPKVFTFNDRYIVYLENDHWEDLEYYDIKTQDNTDTSVDKPIAFGIYDHYLIYVENDAWKDLEYINLLTDSTVDTGIDDPKYVQILNGTIITDKGSYTLK